MRIRVLRRAQYQLRQIFEYIESEFGETVADTYYPNTARKDAKAHFSRFFFGSFKISLYICSVVCAEAQIDRHC